MDASTVLSSWGTSLRTAKRLNTKVCERPDLSEKKGCSATKYVAERLKAKLRERPKLSFLDESLILAQDERWRRA